MFSFSPPKPSVKDFDSIIKNPNRSEFMKGFRKFVGEMDAIVDGDNGDLYVWDSSVMHKQVIKFLMDNGKPIKSPITLYVKKKNGPLRVEISPTTEEVTEPMIKAIRDNRRLKVFLGDNFPIFSEDGDKQIG